MIYIFLADGFEEVEALTPLDILRRAGVEVKLVSISDDPVVEGAHGVQMIADALIADVDLDSATMLVLPGGLPGATNLDACEPLQKALVRHHSAGKTIAAICAAPLVLGHLGLLQGVRATCYPGFETELTGAHYTAALVEHDGQFITGKGPGAAFEFGYTILNSIGKQAEAEQLREGMMYSASLKASGYRCSAPSGL